MGRSEAAGEEEEELSSGVWVDPDELVQLVLAIGKVYSCAAAPPQQLEQLRLLEEQSRAIAHSVGIEYPEHPDEIDELMRVLHGLARRAILADRPEPAQHMTERTQEKSGGTAAQELAKAKASAEAAELRARSAEAAMVQALRRAEAAEAQAQTPWKTAAKTAGVEKAVTAAKAAAEAAEKRTRAVEAALQRAEQRAAKAEAEAARLSASQREPFHPSLNENLVAYQEAVATAQLAKDAADRRARSSEAAAELSQRRAETAEAEAHEARQAVAKEIALRQSAEARAAQLEAQLVQQRRSHAEAIERFTPSKLEKPSFSFPNARGVNYPEAEAIASASASAAAATAAAARDEAEARALRAERELERIRGDMSLHTASREAELAAVAALHQAALQMQSQLPTSPAACSDFYPMLESSTPTCTYTPATRPATAPVGVGMRRSHYWVEEGGGAVDEGWRTTDERPAACRPTTASHEEQTPQRSRRATAQVSPLTEGDGIIPSVKTPRDAQSLMAMLDEMTGGNTEAVHTLPLRSLQTAAQAISAVTSKRIPTPVRQKRVFVSTWYAEARRTSGLVPTARQRTAEDLFNELDARLLSQSRSITQPELPDAVCSHFAEEICKLQGSASLAGRPTHEKRQLVYDWHETQARGTRQRAAPSKESTPSRQPPAQSHASPAYAPATNGGPGNAQRSQRPKAVPLRARGRPDLAGTVIVLE